MKITTSFILTCLTILCLLPILTQSAFKLVKHENDQNARCLDGSPSALYISEGDSDHILVYFEGGGMCSGLTLQATIEDCWKRAQTKLGSSKAYPEEISLEDFSVLSSN